MKLDLAEIETWQEFEELIAAYFRGIHKDKRNHVTEVFVEHSGEGSDGGRDILLTVRVYDSIFTHIKKWVVQCKFYKESVSKSHLSTVNIPTLIHQYGANGYILICKNGVTSKVSEMFEDLRRNCPFSYKYLIWTGSDLVSKIRKNDALIEQFFPKYAIFDRESKRK